MFAIIQNKIGDPSVLTLGEAPTPTPTSEQLLVRVKATALNRADLLQRRGKYPPPPGAPSILGLEIAGEIAAMGDMVKNFKIGQRVFGLVAGGAYAEYCCIDQGSAMLIPDALTFEKAAAIPEAFLTANEAVFTLGDLKKQNSILVHAGASGVGSAAIQMAHHIGATIFTTVGSKEKQNKALEWGANFAINYKEDDFVSLIKQATDSMGVDVVLDFIGAPYLMPNMSVLKKYGRLICIGLLGGSKAEINLGSILEQQLQLKGLMMRTRTLHEKAAMTHHFSERWLPLLAEGVLYPVIDSVFALSDVVKAHERMEANANIGKIVLDLS